MENSLGSRNGKCDVLVMGGGRGDPQTENWGGEKVSDEFLAPSSHY